MRSKILLLVILLSLIVAIPVALAEAGQVSFSDIAGHWAENSIQKLADMGIISGYDDGTFKPDQNITRGEVAAIVDRTVEQQNEDASKIVDEKLAEKVAYPIEAKIESRRGCPSCHVGNYTLQAEAHERAEARGQEHPDIAPDGTSLAVDADPVNVSTCLSCHAPGTGDREGKGLMAPLSLRDIVHPAHLGSQTFKVHYGGNCFTCHNVNGEGTFELLSQAVDSNEKGVPNPDKLPIPGALQPSEK